MSVQKVTLPVAYKFSESLRAVAAQDSAAQPSATGLQFATADVPAYVYANYASEKEIPCLSE